MSQENKAITPAELLASVDPRQAEFLQMRLQSAYEKAEQMKLLGQISVCVGSMIGFTHHGVTENFDFSHGVSLSEIMQTERHEGIAAQAARFAYQKVDVWDFLETKPLEKRVVKTTLSKINSAWITTVPSVREAGHMIGVVPGRFEGEYVVWDANGHLPLLVPVGLQGLLEKINETFHEGFYSGVIFSFRNK